MTAGSDVLGYLFSAGGAVAVLALAALWTTLAPAAARPRRILITSALAFLFFSMYGAQLLVARILIGSYEPFAASRVDARRPSAVVVLGSGSINVEDWDGRLLSFVDHAAAGRVAETVRVFRLTDPAVVVSSGGDPHGKRRGTPTGETMKDALVGAGIPRDRVVVETISKTTRDEAVVVSQLLAERGITQVILVTSGTHMTRALGAFRAVGMPAIPAIAREFDSELPLRLALLPSKEGLAVASTTAHETIGTLYYWLRGWWRR